MAASIKLQYRKYGKHSRKVQLIVSCQARCKVIFSDKSLNNCIGKYKLTSHKCFLSSGSVAG